MAITSNIVLMWEFPRVRKKWWVTPIVATLLLGLILYAAQGSAVGPFIYTIF